MNTDLTQKTMLCKTQLEVILVCMQQLLKDAFSSLTTWIITMEQLGVQWELSLVLLIYQSTSFNIKLISLFLTHLNNLALLNAAQVVI